MINQQWAFWRHKVYCNATYCSVKKLDVTVPWANVYLPPSEYG